VVAPNVSDRVAHAETHENSTSKGGPENGVHNFQRHRRKLVGVVLSRHLDKIRDYHDGIVDDGTGQSAQFHKEGGALIQADIYGKEIHVDGYGERGVSSFLSRRKRNVTHSLGALALLGRGLGLRLVSKERANGVVSFPRSWLVKIAREVSLKLGKMFVRGFVVKELGAFPRHVCNNVVT